MNDKDLNLEHGPYLFSPTALLVINILFVDYCQSTILSLQYYTFFVNCYNLF